MLILISVLYSIVTRDCGLTMLFYLTVVVVISFAALTKYSAFYSGGCVQVCCYILCFCFFVNNLDFQNSKLNYVYAILYLLLVVDVLCS